jgi:long-chain fatty acid transport protein
MTAGVLIFVSFPALAVGPAATLFTARADSAETVAKNPAGMTRLKEPSWYGNPHVMYTESSTKYTVGRESVERTIATDGLIFLPGFYHARPLNDKWSIGIGPSGASGLGGTFNDTWPGRYLVKEWSLVSVGIAPAVAYRVNDMLSIGASLSFKYSRFTLEKSVFNGPGQPDGDFILEADGIGMGGTVGLLYEFNPLSRIGIVYRSEAKAEDKGTPEFSSLSDARKTLLENAGVLNQEISMDTNTPQSVAAGIFQDFENGWTMSADVMWLNFANYNIENITIGDTTISKNDTAHKDIWAGTLGTTYALRPNWSLRSGVLYVSSGLDDEDRTIFSRYDAIWGVGAGVEHEFKSKRKVAVDITYFQLGDGEFTSPNVPVVGSISGEYQTAYGVLLSVGTSY